jgi:hypothetical protein
MSEQISRKWWPEQVCDEMMPPGLDSVDDFIVAESAGGFRLDYPADVDGVTAGRSRALFRRAISEGDIVNFVCCDDLGAAVVRFRRRPQHCGDQWHSQQPLPGGFNWCRAEGDQDTLAETLDDLAANLRDAAEQYFDGGDEIAVMVEFARWTDALPYKFQLTPAGPCFVAAAQAEARQ